jgi:ABC-2 type transport system ATP-binding protein
LEIEVSKNQSLNEIFVALTGQGVEVLSMRNKTNRLEEMFVRLIGENGPITQTAGGAK